MVAPARPRATRLTFAHTMGIFARGPSREQWNMREGRFPSARRRAEARQGIHAAAGTPRDVDARRHAARRVRRVPARAESQCARQSVARARDGELRVVRQRRGEALSGRRGRGRTELVLHHAQSRGARAGAADSLPLSLARTVRPRVRFHGRDHPDRWPADDDHDRAGTPAPPVAPRCAASSRVALARGRRAHSRGGRATLVPAAAAGRRLAIVDRLRGVRRRWKCATRDSTWRTPEVRLATQRRASVTTFSPWSTARHSPAAT